MRPSTATGEWREAIEFNFPPFACIYDHSGRVIVGGGGGASKTGVPNKLILLESATSQDLRTEGGAQLENPQASSVLPPRTSKASDVVLLRKVCVYDTGDDAIMNMALHPFENLLACGVGDRCRVYNVGYRSFQAIGEVTTDFAEKEEDLGQKRVRFSPSGNFIFCAGGDGCVRMFSFPSLQLYKTFAAHSLEKEKETIDLSVTGNMLVSLSRKKCLVYDIHTGSLLHMMEPSDRKLSFRDARFCPVPTATIEDDDSPNDPSAPQPTTLSSGSGSGSQPIYDDHLDDTGPTAPTPNSKETTSETLRSSTFVPDSAFLYTTEFIPKQNGVVKKWDLKSWRCIKSKTIRFNSDHLTAFGVSPDGSTLAVGTVEGQVRVLSSESLSEVYKDATKHEFFMTDFAFDSALPTLPSLVASSSSKAQRTLSATRKHRILYSASGDNTLRATLIPNLAGTRRTRGLLGSVLCCFALFLLLLVLLSVSLVLAQLYRPHDVQQVWRLAHSYGVPSDSLAPHLQRISNQSALWLEEPLSWISGVGN